MYLEFWGFFPNALILAIPKQFTTTITFKRNLGTTDIGSSCIQRTIEIFLFLESQAGCEAYGWAIPTNNGGPTTQLGILWSCLSSLHSPSLGASELSRVLRTWLLMWDPSGSLSWLYVVWTRLLNVSSWCGWGSTHCSCWLRLTVECKSMRIFILQFSEAPCLRKQCHDLIFWLFKELDWNDSSFLTLAPAPRKLSARISGRFHQAWVPTTCPCITIG